MDRYIQQISRLEYCQERFTKWWAYISEARGREAVDMLDCGLL